MRSGRIGSSAVASILKKAATRAAPTTSEATVMGEPQPDVPASTNPNTTPVIPMVDVAAPRMSKRPVGARFR